MNRKLKLLFLCLLCCIGLATAQEFPKVIFPGDYPDPSILRDGKDYYMTHSSFTYSPGFLVWHSQDLVHWEPLCRVNGAGMAPDLVKYGDTYYIYYPWGSTNYVVWAKSMKGPWSKPINLKVKGIDPGHIADKEGNRYLHLSEGTVVKLAPDGLSVVGKPFKVYDGWDYPKEWDTECFCLESPKLTYKDGYYYLTSAEGGTAGPATSHMVVSARSRNITGPWENSPYNPIVHTYSANEQWWSKGHGSLVDDGNGNWWIVYHAYANDFHTLGRSTLLEPIEWTPDGWFRTKTDAILPPSVPVGKEVADISDDFSSSEIDIRWTTFGSTPKRCTSLKNYSLYLQAKGDSPANGRVLMAIPTHKSYEAQVEVYLDKLQNAGLMLFYRPMAFAGIGCNEKEITYYTDAKEAHSVPNPFGKHFFVKITNRLNRCTFWLSRNGKDWKQIAHDIDVKHLNHNFYNGFRSLRIALYASGQGEVRFRDFRYTGLPDEVSDHTPHGLHTDLLKDTETVYANGYSTSASLTEVLEAWKRGNMDAYQVGTIHTPHPQLGWELPQCIPQQTAYRILMATSPQLLTEGKADVWDSGEVQGSNTSGIVCQSNQLKPARIYYWTVKVKGIQGIFSPYATPRSFLTANAWDKEFARLPLRKTEQTPISLQEYQQGCWFADFGKAAFSQLSLRVQSAVTDTLIVHLGEDSIQGKVHTQPGGSIRYAQYKLVVHPGTDTYHITIRTDRRNAKIKPYGQAVRPVLMPDYIGEVYPFRYCQIESKGVRLLGMQRQMVHYAWNDDASYFHSSDSVLNRVWELCRYTMLATSFAGVYVDGDRERIPYEADALINQLSHYCTDQEYSLARYSVDYLCHNATWPTEWILQAPLMAWNDYLYTGNTALLQKDYDILKARTLLDLRETNGLISTRTGKQTPELLHRCGYFGQRIKDIVDWPRSGALGVGKEKPGEADGYELKDYNTVVNAFHYQALHLMSRIAQALGKDGDAAFFQQQATDVRNAINRLLLDTQKGCFRDGIGSDHHSLHASMFPLAFGIVPSHYVEKVRKHIESRGMACSVYGAQFLLEALYASGGEEHALQMMTSTGQRSWWNMLRMGATMTTEAWDREFKPNLTWNHAWGAAPANIIPRKLMGIEPIEPGWKRMRIQPRPGSLQQAEVHTPTPLGTVKVSFVRLINSFSMCTTIPAGTIAEVALPCRSHRHALTINGKPVHGTWQNGYLLIELNPGAYQLNLTQK